jgi:arabinose-5-phosphate isomerase
VRDHGVNESRVLQVARGVIDAEARAIGALSHAVDCAIVDAVQAILSCAGRVIASGVGKSGIIARKIAATMTVTGTPAYYLHPSDAVHGDLGLVCPEDLILVVSHSGETHEAVQFVREVKVRGNAVVAITRSRDSTIANLSDVALCTSVRGEVGELGLVPTASATAAMVLGDAVAMACAECRGFDRRALARNHPGGIIGATVHGVPRERSG